MPIVDWTALGRRACEGVPPSREEAVALLCSPDAEFLPILHAAFLPRERFHGRRVRLHLLLNAKSGRCPEDCKFCSQSARAEAGVEEYPLVSTAEIVAGALRARELQAAVYCIVTSGRRPSAEEFESLCDAAREIRRRAPGLRLCFSLGALDDAAARRLREAGADRFNHNLETSERRFPDVCSSHAYADRVATVRAVKRAGLHACCGGIVGLGESPEDIADLAFALRDLDVDSIPVNFFNPRPGTAFADLPQIAPAYALKALALMRLVNPAKDIRSAGGREAVLRSMQPLALFAANSIFVEGYLTTPGQGADADRRMIADAGFEIDVETAQETSAGAAGGRGEETIRKGIAEDAEGAETDDRAAL
jgi:biotin synthase